MSNITSISKLSLDNQNTNSLSYFNKHIYPNTNHLFKDEKSRNYYIPRDITTLNKNGNLLIITNTRGNYGLYPGFYAPIPHPQAKIETHRVMIKWGNYIGESFLNGNLGNYVNYLHTYYLINNNPSIGNPTILKNLILTYIYGFSSSSSSIILLGHSSPTLWEAYYWNPSNVGLPSYHLLPENSEWTPPYVLSVIISSNEVRDYIDSFSDDITIDDLPKMAFVIGCNSLKGGIENLDNNWAKAFFFTYNDYISGLWNDRILLGYDDYIYYNPITGDFPGAKLVKKIFDNIGSGDSIYDALRKASNDLGFPYKICGTPIYCTTSNALTTTAHAGLLGSNIYNDPEPESIALGTVKSFILNSYPDLWPLIEPNITVARYDSSVMDLFGLNVYEVSSRLSYVYPVEPNITVIVDLSFYVDVHGESGDIVSLSLNTGNYYNSSVLDSLVEKYGKNVSNILSGTKQWVAEEKLSGINDLYTSVLEDINTSLWLLESHGLDYEKHLFSDPTSEVVNVEYVAYKNISGVKWYLYAGSLDRLNPTLYPVRIYLVYDPSNGILIYDNYIKALVKKHADLIEQYDFTPAISLDKIQDIAVDNIDDSNQIHLNKLVPILIIQENSNLRPYYYLEYINSSDTIGYRVFVDAIDGSVEVYKGYLADSNSSIPDTDLNNLLGYSMPLGLMAGFAAIIVVSVAFILVKRYRLH